jgi:hypothetical protein
MVHYASSHAHSKRHDRSVISVRSESILDYRLFGADALQENQLILDPDGLKERWADQFQVVPALEQKAPAGGNLVGRDQVLFRNQIVKIGQPVRQQPVELGPVQHAPFGDPNLSEKLLVAGMAVLPQAVAVELRK